jgi:PAS domain-containing protein
MTQTTLLAALLDSLTDPLIFADIGHVIRYMNKAAIAHYEDGSALLGRSLLDCHNAESQRLIRAIFTEMIADGLDERLITDTSERRIFMRAVRDAEGDLLGYFERFEPPRQAAAPS